MSAINKWRIEDSAELYNIGGWGLKYFSINENGHVTVTPKSSCVPVDLADVMDELHSRKVTAPVLLRFPDILDNRIDKISSCFKKAAKEYEYQGANFIVYPIKVNQMRQVVEEIIGHGKKFNIGLEAVIICNGYKDEGYIELALLAQKMGRRIFVVVEKLSELELIDRVAQRLHIRPNIGFRIKLSSSGSGKWEESGGDSSKFGLNTSELFSAIDYMHEHKLEDCLKLIHFHIGSQVTKIRRIKNALREAAQFYVQLAKLGFEVEYVDIGGGLGVDYDGTRSGGSGHSMNYSIQEYVNDAVYTLVDASNKNGLKHPNIINESGRSLTAHHSVLVVDVLETTSLPEWDDKVDTVSENDDELVRDIYEIWDKINQARLLEDWHDALQIRDEALDRFSLGLIDLRTRAMVEKLFWSVARDVDGIVRNMKHAPDELRSVSRMLPDKYFCNFSLFQSLPDAWAIDQVFPVIPIDRLAERPTHYATLQDMTCDSDGKLTNFISSQGIAHSLPVHKLKHGQHYYLGVIDGETVAEVLDYVEFNPKQLVRNVETWVSESIRSGKITSEEGNEFVRNFRSGLYGYTYLEK